MNIPAALIPVIAALFDYSFKPINYDWDLLTKAEREAVGSRELWDQLVKWLKEGHK